MQHTGWPTTPLLGSRARQPTIACVLSGGGSRASFQLGALDYLYRNDQNFSPTIFVGASAGSILSACLAQDKDRDVQYEFVTKLLGIWHELNDPEQLFTPRPWLVRAQAEAPGWLNLVNSRPPPEEPAPRTFPKLPFQKPSPASPPSPPLMGPLELALEPDREPTQEWSLGTLAHIFSNVGKLPRIGSDLVTIHHGMEQTKSMYRPGPVLLELLDPQIFDPAHVRTAGTTLRIAMVALESGELRFMREDGALVDRTDRVFDAGPYPLPTGVLASCAIPAVFRPVPLGAETYVDGGVRDNLPVQLTMESLNADKTYLISSQSLGVPARQSMKDADLFSIVMRSTEILIDETGRDEMLYAATTDATIIRPELSVHDAMGAHPGLIAINIDYGWLRAAETHLGSTGDEIDRHRRIVALRIRCVRLEEEFLAGSGDAAHSLAQSKAELRELVGQCDPQTLPAGAGQWWRSFEPHTVVPDVAPPWLTDEDLAEEDDGGSSPRTHDAHP